MLETLFITYNNDFWGASKPSPSTNYDKIDCTALTLYIPSLIYKLKINSALFFTVNTHGTIQQARKETRILKLEIGMRTYATMVKE